MTGVNAVGGRDGLLAGKIAFITGAGRGIGAAAARLFAREGAAVVLAARTESQLVDVVNQIRAAGGTADYVLTDLTDPGSVQAAVDTVIRLHKRLDVAFNNAGVSIPHTPMVNATTENFDLVSAVNYRGVFLSMTAEIRAIRATAGAGAIVNNSSVGSFRGAPGLGPYAATKRAVNSLTETAAAEYGPEGIRVNAIAPGTTMTGMIRRWAEADPTAVERLNALTPLRRAADPDEIAEAAAWLLSDRASFVTGVCLPVDGGLRA
ncbi:SDR family NAD(P)-dependent oxidoreductase [Micromonospora sp. HM5-17]|uniref:SDR family NAD(P)-dependent oxidoreductase n=1 Tax=Micromonospora sp. HM5-17 TaxID=2487710 RepID=UPI000F4A18A9|nr:glucose 1-dehydrogenase [Micromonospora sp. HM5-17]ROT29794.1 glucose 1-dehydrogenase [Micromonospora sp. HM5-17]